MRRRPLITALPAAVALAAVAGRARGSDGPPKVLRYAFSSAESGFDPAQVSDLYSRTVTGHIFESLYQYDPLARPYKLRPLLAAGWPETSEDFRVWTVRIQPGIYFASDPAFKGQRRELVAADFVYAFKRFADAALKSPTWPELEAMGVLGLAELRRQAIESKQPFDYDKPIDGLRALDRHTLQFRLREPAPRFVTSMLAKGDLRCAVAREVVEFYGKDIMAHPVGTGPFKLVQWRRSSFIALERNPEYREVRYAAEPAPGDAEGQALLARFKGRRLPMIDRVEISIIDEAQPRWLSFLQRQHDFMDVVPGDFIARAMPGGVLAPNLVRQGMRGYRMPRADSTYTYFNMDDPVVGGYTPGKVALRRAIGLAIDLEREIRLVRGGQAIAAQSQVVPHSSAYDPAFKSENSEYNLPRAKALLELYGYTDKNGDGWREQPDGSPLLLKKSTTPNQANRQLDEQWQRNMNALGVRIEFLSAKFQEQLKAARAGKLQIWGLGGLAEDPDSLDSLVAYDSQHIGGGNYARFKLPQMDALIQRLRVLPDGPERLALFREVQRLGTAYMPYKTHVHRVVSDIAQPWLIGYRRPVFWNDYWQYLDIDTSRLPKA